MKNAIFLGLALVSFSFLAKAQSDENEPVTRKHEVGMDITIFAAHAKRISFIPEWSGVGGFFVFETYYKRHFNKISFRGSYLFFEQNYAPNITGRGHFIKLGAEYSLHERKFYRLYAGADVLLGRYSFEEYQPFIPYEMQEGRVPHFATGFSPFLGIDLKMGKHQAFILSAQLGPDFMLAPEGTVSNENSTFVTLPRGIFSRVSLGYRF